MNSQFQLLPALFAIVTCTVLFFLTKWKNKSGKPKRLPPGPPRLPILGNLHQLGSPLHVSLLELSKKHGDLIFLQLGYAPALVVSSAEIIREIVKNHDLAFSGRPLLRVADKLAYDNSDLVFSSYGEYWREMRKITVLELLSVKRVQTFQPIRDEEVALLVDNIARSSGPVNLTELLYSLANNVVCRVAFGRKFQPGSTGKRTPREMLQEIQELIASLCLSDFFPWMGWLNKVNGFDARIERNFNEFDQLYDQIIQEHLDPMRTKSDHEDIVDVLLRLRQEPNQNVTVSDKSVKALIADMFIAATESSSGTLTWAMTELIRNPTVINKAQDEVRSVVMGKERVEESDLPKLSYLRSVVKETLRFHPPAPLLLPRETTEDVQLRGYDIPAKTRVFINAKAMLFDPKSWEDPCEFRPERFLNNPIDFRGKHFEFIPFGAGRRMCPGINFALVVIELTLANILYRFNWEMPPGVTRENMDVDEASGLAVLKKTPLYLVANPVIVKI